MQIYHNLDEVDILAALYLALKSSGRADEVFYDGHDLRWFIELMQTRTNYICSEDGKIVGFGVVNENKHQGKRCEVSFCFLPDVKPRSIIKFGVGMIDRLFKDHPCLDYAFGTTPSENTKALKFARLIGMKQVAVLPNYVEYKGESCDAVISYIDREMVNGKV